MNRRGQVITSSNKKFSHVKDGDHISNLHPSILSDILSRLPTKEAVQTCILAKHWKFKWTCVYNVNTADDFHHDDEERKTAFVNFVDRVIYHADNVTSFHLKTGNMCSPYQLSTWISTLLERKVESLEIATVIRQEAIVLPFSLLSSTTSSLRILKLNVPCTFKNVDSKICFLNLTSLILQGVQFLNGNSDMDTLSLSFPVLETLATMYCKWVDVKSVEIYAPALTTFSSRTSANFLVRNYSIKIFSPKLVAFGSSGRIPENIVMDGGSRVVSASLRNANHGHDLQFLRDIGVQVWNILNGFSGVEELTLSNFIAGALLRSGLPLRCYGKLRRLILFCRGHAQQVFDLLSTAPVLNYLSVNMISWSDYDYDAMESIPCCISSHLEELDMASFSSKEPEINFAKFFLKNGGELKKLSFEGYYSTAERKRIMENLSIFPRRQISLTFFFRQPDEIIVVP